MLDWLAKYRGDIFNVISLVLSVAALLAAAQAKRAVNEFRQKARRLNVLRVLDRVVGVLEVLTDCRDSRFPQRHCDEVRTLLIEVLDSPMLTADNRKTIELHLAQIRSAPENNPQTVAFLRKIHEEIGRLAAIQRRALEELL
jgi:hypothetical protein